MVPRLAILLVRMALGGFLVVGCWPYANPTAPPTPAAARIPTIVGQIGGWAPDNVSYRLEGGDVVDVGGPGSSAAPAALLSDTRIWMPSSDSAGGLLLFGEDADGRFYAATQPDEGGCFLVRGQGYIEPDRVHLSSGLVLFYAADLDRHNGRGRGDPSWLLSFDSICLNGDGRVTFINQLPLGA